ncbi:MAG TPA: hypothetical protein EYG11_12305 [Candidatus Latescibacteria bacterium]|nr:hypothetical protein [Candidatus Handelsmanbacteria bacterium]HIL09475.1 hypothetical protein [Candidatus Latescibacterota bacterium]
MRISLLLCGILLSAYASRADRLTFDSAAAWESWEAPYGLVQIGDAGQLQLIKYRKNTNVIADAHLFTHKTKTRGDEIPGGIWEAGSGQATADRVIDGDPATFWKPDPDDVVGEWFVQLDLGRAVLAKEIRLKFPDQEGARPFKQFTVFIATGVTSDPLDDLFLFDPVYRTTRPNEESEISIPLRFTSQNTSQVLDPDLNVDPVEKDQYRLVQYINFTVEAIDLEGALAEIEVVGVGDNVSIGVDRRGFVIDGLTSVSNLSLFDANVNTNNAIAPVAFAGRERSWLEQGTWFYADLGAIFWLDEVFIYILKEQEGTAGFIAGPARGFTILGSDGTRSIGTELPVPEPFDYNELLFQPDNCPDCLHYLRYQFQAKRVRYLLWHVHSTSGWNSKWAELMLFSPGHPAEVTMRSNFIDLGEEAGDGRPKVIKSLNWDADLTTGARLQLRSRSGNTLSEVYDFYDRKGEQVTEEKWLSSPKVLRGEIDTSIVVGEDWDAWSEEYKSSDEAFKSQNPRRFVQLEMIISTDDPTVGPTVNALSIDFEDAFLQEAKGSILPRAARPNEDTRFTYTLWPKAEALDSGFDLLRFVLTEAAETNSVEITAAGLTIAPTSVEMLDDSLLVSLPAPIRGDSVQVSFITRVIENATVFSLDLGSSERPDTWQSVEAMQRRSNIVMLPELTGSGLLINDLQVPDVFTPNGDGVNDLFEVRFVAFKIADADPEVSVFDLAGRRRGSLITEQMGTQQRHTWSGRDDKGEQVEPGVYLLRIDLGADAGGDTATRVFSVAY